MISEMRIDAGMAMLAKQENCGSYQRKYSNRRKRIHDLSDDVFIFRKLLLNLKFKKLLFFPYIEDKKKWDRKNKVAQRVSAYLADKFC